MKGASRAVNLARVHLHKHTHIHKTHKQTHTYTKNTHTNMTVFYWRPLKSPSVTNLALV